MQKSLLHKNIFQQTFSKCMYLFHKLKELDEIFVKWIKKTLMKKLQNYKINNHEIIKQKKLNKQYRKEKRC